MLRNLRQQTRPPIYTPPLHTSLSQQISTLSGQRYLPISSPVVSRPQFTSAQMSTSLEDFLANERTHQHPLLPEGRQITPAERTALELRETRDRFSKKHERGNFDDTGRSIIRAAVLDVYEQAIGELGRQPELYAQIASEANRKVRVILDIIPAEPDDPIFLTTGQLLKPLEPHYSQPRIIECGPDEDDETYAHRAQYRLEAWRAEGWPDAYPRKAVMNEKKRGKSMVGAKRMVAGKLRERHVNKSNEELGGIVEGEKGNEDGEKASHVPGVRKRRNEDGKLVVRERKRYDDDKWD